MQPQTGYIHCIQGKDTSFFQKMKNILSTGLCKTAQTEKNIIKM